MNMAALIAKADDQPNIPASSWEQHPEGVALALMLTKGIGNDSQSIYLRLFVKNTSDNPVPLMGGPAVFFYLDSSGNPVNLGNNSEDDIIENFQRWKVIAPGKIRSTETEVTTAEVAVIKANTVKCKILLLDRATHKEVPVVGSPQLLNPQSL
ncbi:MAG: hypothetical protein LV481_04055 [Methylacidiphilales bacterium]|nr:hypothetical protein [Candidatus Methylacidiphilales bacterium]